MGISVINLTTKKILKSISLKGIPDGITMSPNGKYICAILRDDASDKNMIVIDCRADEVVKSIPNIGNGSAIGITPDNKKIYVSNIENNGINKINVVEMGSYKLLKTIECNATSFSFVPDRKYVFAVGKLEVVVIKTDVDVISNRLPFATQPDGMAISDDGRAYVWLPRENRTFMLPIEENLENEIGYDPATQIKEIIKANEQKNKDFELFRTKMFNDNSGFVKNIYNNFGNKMRLLILELEKTIPMTVRRENLVDTIFGGSAMLFFGNTNHRISYVFENNRFYINLSFWNTMGDLEKNYQCAIMDDGYLEMYKTRNPKEVERVTIDQLISKIKSWILDIETWKKVSN